MHGGKAPSLFSASFSPNYIIGEKGPLERSDDGRVSDIKNGSFFG